MITSWLDSLVTFPSDFQFLKYLIISALVLMSVVLLYGLVVSVISGLFNRR